MSGNPPRVDPIAARRHRDLNIHIDRIPEEVLDNAPHERLRAIAHARQVAATAGPTLSTVGKRTRADVRAAEKVPDARGLHGKEREALLASCASTNRKRKRGDGGGGDGDDGTGVWPVDATGADDDMLATQMGDMTTDQDIADLTDAMAAMAPPLEAEDGTDATGVDYEKLLSSENAVNAFEEGKGGQFDPKAGLSALRNCFLWKTVHCNIQLLVMAVEELLDGIKLFGCRDEWLYPQCPVNTVAGSVVARSYEVPLVPPTCPFRAEDMVVRNDGKFVRHAFKARDLRVVRLDLGNNKNVKGGIGGYAHTRGIPVVVHMPSRMAYMVDTHIAAYFGISWPFVWYMIARGVRSHQIKSCMWATQLEYEAAQTAVQVLRADWDHLQNKGPLVCESWVGDVRGGQRVFCGSDYQVGAESVTLPSLCQIVTGLEAIKSSARTITDKMGGSNVDTLGHGGNIVGAKAGGGGGGGAAVQMDGAGEGGGVEDLLGSRHRMGAEEYQVADFDKFM